MPFEGSADKSKLSEFLDQRASIRVLVVRIGDGIKLPNRSLLASGAELALGDVQRELVKAVPVQDQKDHVVVVRPRFAAELLDADPGAASYHVVKMHAASHLEWWHLQLQPPSSAESWLDFATQIGLDMGSYRAPNSPKATLEPTTGSPVPWMGGGYEGKKTPNVPNKLKVSPDPGNQPGRGKRPE